jgi:hypothetical protein
VSAASTAVELCEPAASLNALLVGPKVVAYDVESLARDVVGVD